MYRQRYEDTIKSIASDIKSLSDDLRFNVSVQLLFSGLLLNKYIDVKASRYGQNRSRLDILHTLITHGGILRPSDLSKMLLRSRQTITGTIDGLERDGLVQRELNGSDRRTKRVFITKKGLDSVRKSLPSTMEITNTALPELSQEQMQELTTVLRKIRKHLVAQLEKTT